MSSFIYCADTHIKGKNPENRIGNFYQDLMAKIKEIIFIAKKHSVDFIVHGGDLFNSPDVSNIMIDEFIDLVEQSKIIWYVIFGNHDEFGHSPELSKSSALAHIFRRSKYIKHLDTEILNASKQEGVDAVLQGFDYYHLIESDIKEKGLMCKYPKAKFKIAVPHAFITLKPFLPHVMHIRAKNVKTDFDIILCSHYHSAWNIKEFNGAKFVNLGAIGRQGIDEINRTPQVLLVDTDTKKLEIIKLKSAKPGKEVFDLEKVEKRKAFEQNIDNFIESLDNVKFQSLDIIGRIMEIGKEKNIEKEVIEEVINRIGKSEVEE